MKKNYGLGEIINLFSLFNAHPIYLLPKKKKKEKK